MPTPMSERSKFKLNLLAMSEFVLLAAVSFGPCSNGILQGYSKLRLASQLTTMFVQTLCWARASRVYSMVSSPGTCFNTSVLLSLLTRKNKTLFRRYRWWTPTLKFTRSISQTLPLFGPSGQWEAFTTWCIWADQESRVKIKFTNVDLYCWRL